MKKKCFFIVVFLLLIMFIYFSGLYETLLIFIRNANINTKPSYYENYALPLDYFYSNRNDLDTILDFMNNNRIIEEIKRYSICSSKLYQYEFKHNYILCANNELNGDIIKNIEENIIEKIYNMQLEKVILAKSNDGVPMEYDFRLISTSFYIVQYVYCLERSECNTESKYTKLSDEGYIIKNQIDDNWYTSYHHLPAL